MALKVRGCRVAVYSREDATDPRAEITRAIGAESLDRSPEQMTAGLGNIDPVYWATGSPHRVFDMLGVLGRNGVLFLPGNFESGDFLNAVARGGAWTDYRPLQTGAIRDANTQFVGD